MERATSLKKSPVRTLPERAASSDDNIVPRGDAGAAKTAPAKANEDVLEREHGSRRAAALVGGEPPPALDGREVERVSQPVLRFDPTTQQLIQVRELDSGDGGGGRDSTPDTATAVEGVSTDVGAARLSASVRLGGVDVQLAVDNPLAAVGKGLLNLGGTMVPVGAQLRIGPRLTQELDIRLQEQLTDGRLRVSVSTTVEAAMHLHAELNLGKLGAAFTTEQGEAGRVSYDLVLTPDQLAEIYQDPNMLPTPSNPMGLPPGSSMVVRTEDYRRVGGSVDIAGVGIGSSRQSGDGTSIAIQALAEEGSFRVAVGPHDTVTNGASVGLGATIGAVRIGVGASHSATLDETTALSATFQLPEAMEAYERFRSTGELPPAGTAGVSDAEQLHVFESTVRTRFQVEVGPLRVTHQIEGTSSETWRYRDGQIELALLWTNGARTTQDAVTGEWISFANELPPQSEAQGLAYQAGAAGALDHTGGFEVSFTGEAFQALSEQERGSLLLANPAQFVSVLSRLAMRGALQGVAISFADTTVDLSAVDWGLE